MPGSTADDPGGDAGQVPLTPARVSELMSALGEQLHAVRAHFELVIIGGSALQALGLVQRVTRDVDVVAIRTDSELVPAEPLPDALLGAARRVARDFGLRPDWLNAGPADLVRLGLPLGFLDRVATRSVGPSLTLHYASRYDQIHFKLYAMADQRSARHEADLRALDPTAVELVAASTWARTHDPSEPFRDELVRAIRSLGIPDVDLDA